MIERERVAIESTKVIKNYQNLIIWKICIGKKFIYEFIVINT